MDLDTAGSAGIVAEVARIMTDLESEHQQAGWDELPPVLYPVVRDGDDGFGAHLLYLGTPNVPPADQLTELASVMGTPQGAAEFGALYDTPPVAHMLIVEAWVAQPDEDETQEAFEARRAGRDLADIPGSIEARVVIAVLDEGSLMLARKRGSEPEFVGWSAVGSGITGVLRPALQVVHEAAWTLYWQRGQGQP